MLEVKEIAKKYKDVYALHQVSFQLEDGIYALLGPNGAGKSTLMNLICRQLVPTSGEILWEGSPVKQLGNGYYENLGYAPQQQGLYEDMTGLRFLTYMALLKNIPKDTLAKEVQRVATLVNMQDVLYQKCRKYSGGMKQRILVAQALLGKPKLLLLDEPTAGLDPKERVSLRNVFASLANDHIIFIATHVVSDVESIAKKVLFLKKGELVDQGSVDQLLAKYKQDSLENVYLHLFGKEHV